MFEACQSVYLDIDAAPDGDALADLMDVASRHGSVQRRLLVYTQ